MERQIENYFEEERGKRGGETESYSLNETEQEGEKGRGSGKREGGTSVREKVKFFTAAQRQIV